MKKYEIYLTYDSYETGGVTEDDSKFSDYSDIYRETIWKNAYVFYPESFFIETVEIDFNPENVSSVYLVTVIYDSGDTFGTSHGNVEVVGVFDSLEKANKIKKQIEHEEKHPKETSKLNIYKPWIGHFENFNSVEINVLNVLKK